MKAEEVQPSQQTTGSLPLSNRPLRDITEKEIQSYERDGVVLLKGIYPPEWVSYLERNLDDIFNQDLESMEYGDDKMLSGDNPNGGMRGDLVEIVTALKTADPAMDLALDGPPDEPLRGRSLIETNANSWHQGVRAHHLAGPLPEIVAQLTRSDKVNFYDDQLFCKDPGSKIRTPWHQDKPYFLLQGEKVAVCWVSPDYVNKANGAMGYVPGSHASGIEYKTSDFITRTGSGQEAEDMSHAHLEPMPRIDGDEASFGVVYFNYEPGDVIVHHWATIHGSSGNISAKLGRRAASVRYAGDDVTYYKKPSSPEPFRNSLSLTNGDLLEKSERFPVVWPRQD